MLLLDEPSSGLDRQETADLARTLRAVQAEQGFAILLVEHDVEFVAGFTDRTYVLVHDVAVAAAIIGKTAQLELYDLETSLVPPSIDAAQNQLSAILGAARAEAIALQKVRGVFFYVDPTTDRVSAATAALVAP